MNCDPKQPTVSCPQPNGHHRFEFLLMPGQTKEEMEDAATVLRLLAHYVEVDKVEVLRRLVYTFNALVAERWRDGRVLLAGDAAHMTPQFMGQGMSSGVRDAHNLAWKLEAVLRKGADSKLIDTYQSERKPHAKEMIDISVKMKDFVSLANPVLAKTRNVVVKTLLKTPRVGDYLREARFKPPPTYPNGDYFGLPRKRRSGADGRPIPQPQARTYDGRRALPRRHSRRRLRARRLRLRPAREPRRNELGPALGARRKVCGALPLRRAPSGRRGQARLRGGRAGGVGGPRRRRYRLVPPSRREERRRGPRSPGQVRLRPDAGGATRRGREPGA